MFLKQFLLLICPISTISPHLLQAPFSFCTPPTICTPIAACQEPPDVSYNFYVASFTMKRPYCAMGSVCCNLNQIPTSTVSTASTSSTTTPSSAVRVVRKNDELIDHRNFKILPLDRCGVISSKSRITSGDGCSLGEFPWMALIAYKTGNSTSKQDFRCGGTLINENYILTAAHCINMTTIFGVRLGEYNILTETDCDEEGCAPPVQDILIEEVITHPFYNPATFMNDIALIRLANPANFSQRNIDPICLPFGELLGVNLEEQLLVVAGWGSTEFGGKSTTLRKVSVPVVPTSTCKRLYQDLKPITSKQICAGGDNGRDACAGDSGGPLKRVDFINNAPRYVQYGIVSYGPTSCGVGTRPGIYTNVRRYMRWILDNLEE